MSRNLLCTVPALLVLAALGTSVGHAGDLSFEDRVATQEAIERVYHSHRVGAEKPFEESVSRELLKRKVVGYLKQSAALEKIWHTPVTAEMLERELLRMSRGTRMPERLMELFAALDDDPVLMQECLARATLADRLTRSFFAFDKRFHATARQEAVTLREALANGALGTSEEHPRRTVVELVRESDIERSDRRARLAENLHAEGAPDGPVRLVVSSPRFVEWRARMPGSSGTISPVDEEREAFIVRALLEGDDERLLMAVYRVEKTAWHTWWNEVAPRLDVGTVVRVASRDAMVPLDFGGRNRRWDTHGGEPVHELLPGESLGAPCDPDDTWGDGSLVDVVEPRLFHTAVWTGTEMIVWGGWNRSGERNTGARYDPATDSWTATTTELAPSPRRLHTAVWTGTEMIIWGGWDDVHQSIGGRYDPLTDKWAPISTANAPSPRTGHTAVWTGSVMVVWGGGSDTGGRYTPSTDTWAPTSITNAPPHRSNHTAVWSGSLMLIWGGRDGSAPIGTGGEYNPVADTWEAMPTLNSPSARFGHTAVWTGSRMVIWGGGWTNTGAQYDPAADTWSVTSTGAGVPSGRSDHTAVWSGTEMIVWGGWDNPFYSESNGGRYNPATDSWAATELGGGPWRRRDHTAVWTGGLMLVWGGDGGENSEPYLYTGGRYEPGSDSWTPTSIGTAGAPSPRTGDMALWTGSLMVVWSDGTGGRYDPATDNWTPTSTDGAPPDGATVWTGSLILAWGGDAGGRYDPVTDTWEAISTTGAPSPRSGHSAVWADGVMVVWGGRAGSTYFDTGGRYDLATDSWTATSTAGAPAPRVRQSTVWTGTEMIVWGGNDATYTLLDSGGRYDPTADNWTATSTLNAPTPRTDPTAVWTGSLMLVWGGEWSNLAVIGGRYDPVTDSWTPISTTGAPDIRGDHTAVWAGSVMVVWGGTITADDFYDVNTGGRYDPLGDTWESTSTERAPHPRSTHAAVWTGSHMLIFGGVAFPDPPFNTGGMYALGHSSDDDGDGLSECDGDCNDALSLTYPGAIEVCDGHDNQCPGDVNHGQIDEGCDDDGDAYCDAFMVVVGHPTVCPEGGDDCSDDDSSVYPGAPEVNDGFDNQCPGDLGHGVIDETSGRSGFRSPGDKNEYSWEPQDGATLYEVAWSVTRDFTHGCAFTITSDTSIPTGEPLLGGVNFYLNRPFRPNLGSWGQDSLGRARVVSCRLSGGESDLWEDRGR